MKIPLHSLCLFYDIFIYGQSLVPLGKGNRKGEVPACSVLIDNPSVRFPLPRGTCGWVGRGYSRDMVFSLLCVTL